MFVYLAVLLALILALIFFNNRMALARFTRADYLKLLEQNQVSKVLIHPNQEVPSGRIEIEDKEGRINRLNVLDVKEEEAFLKTEYKDIPILVDNVERDGLFLSTLLAVMAGGAVCIFALIVMSRRAGGAAPPHQTDFAKSPARMSYFTENEMNFDKVAGLVEEKEELEQVVDFLRFPDKYIRLGARIPKGLLMVGPPGTGKTLLAKAVAGEAKVPFFTISGSDFVEMYVGVGASRVRHLFKEAKKHSPCIIFIDEIDAVGRRRGTGMGGGHDEREQTLNQLLVEMDGFGLNQGIIVMAATNRVDILDPALLRPGRFDRKVVISPPDVVGRESILKVHAKDKPLGDDVNLEEIARTTAGFTGADLENLMNEAAIISARGDRAYISQEDIKNSFIKLGIGTEKKSRIISPKEKEITAYHEAGHAILFHILEHVGPVHTISVIPTGMGAAGYTMPLPEKDQMFWTKSKMLDEIVVSFGGRIAEEFQFGDITTGASGDIKQATRIAKAMVVEYGMSENIGMIDYSESEGSEYGNTTLMASHSYSEETSKIIDHEVKAIIDSCYERGKTIIKENMDILHSTAKYLMEHEKMDRETFEAQFNKD